jgi:HK97 gp10 family phage protein
VGKFDFQVDPAFLKQLGRLADVDRIAPKMIDEAIPALERDVKSEASKHRVTGAMAGSIKKTKANKQKNGGYYASVRPTGTDSKGVRNMEKMAYAEFGTSKQAPTPMLTKAIKDSESEVLNKMSEVFKREVSE